MTSITIIDNFTFKFNGDIYAKKMGSLMFPAELYDCKHHINMRKFRKNIEEQIPKGSRVLKILINTTNSPNFKNIKNPLLPYKHPVCAEQTTDGAYHKVYPDMDYFSMWAVDFPVGDAIIVVSKTFETNIN